MTIKKQPINLDLMTIKLPVTAIVSILHRISGIILFLFVPILLYVLDYSLRSALQFEQLRDCLSAPSVKVGIWVFLSALSYHFIAGVRHLIMDMGWGESLSSGVNSAWVVIVLTLLAIVLFGFWLW